MVLSLNSKRKCSPPSNAGNELSKIFGYGLPHLISMAGWLCVVPMTMAMTDYENTLTHTT